MVQSPPHFLGFTDFCWLSWLFLLVLFFTCLSQMFFMLVSSSSNSNSNSNSCDVLDGIEFRVGFYMVTSSFGVARVLFHCTLAIAFAGYGYCYYLFIFTKPRLFCCQTLPVL